MSSLKRDGEPRGRDTVDLSQGASGVEAWLRQVIDAAPSAMLMIDQRGVLTLVNRQAEMLFGYSRAELLGSSVESLVPQRFRAAHDDHRHGFFAHPDTRAMGAGRDLYGLRKDGSEVPIEIGLNPLRSDAGLFVLASIIDITERKRMSDQMVSAEARLRLVIDAAPNAMLMIKQSGEMILVNAQAERLFGYQRQELLGQTIEMLVPQRFHGVHGGYRNSFFAHPDTRAMGAGRELFGLRKDGSEVPIEIGLNPLQTDEGLFVLAAVIDITERKRAAELTRLAQADALRQSIIDSAPFSIIAIDTQGVIIAANPASERMLGYTRAEMVGQRAVSLIHLPEEIERRSGDLVAEHSQAAPPAHLVIVARAERGLTDEREWTYVHKDGSQVPVNLSITPLHDESGNISGFLKVAYDITERKRSEAFILHMAHHDALTGLPNRVLLIDRIEMAIGRARRLNKRLSVLMMDLDHFKRVNDSLGHQAGDQLLLTVAQRIREELRDSDTVARLGGDEFVIVLDDVGSRDGLRGKVDGIVQSISAPMLINDHELVITPSIGGCLFPDDGNDASTLLKNADAAMYSAKAAGRSNCQWFSHEMQQQADEKLALGSALRRALDSKQMLLDYQPQLSLVSGEVIGVEALIRWNHPKRGAIPPDDFITIAEETGLILPIGEWVLRHACADQLRMQQSCSQKLTMAVNVSPRQLQQKNWIQVLRNALGSSGIDPTLLELEITEGMLMHNSEHSATILREIRTLGIGIVIDDFGTGYSSLSYLTRFPIDKIKIDRSFVRDLTVDAKDAAVIDAIIAMAHSLKIRVIAEGVETREQLDYLRARGCDEAQGFYFSPAVGANELPSLIGVLPLRMQEDSAAG